MIYIGIDPGKQGGVGMVDRFGRGCISMPDTEKDIFDVFSQYRGKEVFALIERVGAMPGQGVVSMFTFGKGYGGLRMALIGNGIPFEEVSPQTWMKEFGIKRDTGESKTDFKKRLRAKAQQLFPNLNINLYTADASLIAEYARRKHERKK